MLLEIKGQRLEFNLYDAECAGRYEAALERLQEQGEAQGSLAAQIRVEHGKVAAFFDTLFGEGTAEGLFEGRCDLNDALDCAEVILHEAARQTEDMQKRVALYNVR